jgi:hypothetical protein
MCCKGSPTTFTSGYPQLDKYLQGNLGKSANQYPGPVSAQMNPLMTGAANMMSNYAGQGNYQAPGYNTYASMMPQVGQGQGQAGGQGQGQNAQMMAMIQAMLGQRQPPRPQ